MSEDQDRINLYEQETSASKSDKKSNNKINFNNNLNIDDNDKEEDIHGLTFHSEKTSPKNNVDNNKINTTNKKPSAEATKERDDAKTHIVDKIPSNNPSSITSTQTDSNIKAASTTADSINTNKTSDSSVKSGNSLTVESANINNTDNSDKSRSKSSGDLKDDSKSPMDRVSSRGSISIDGLRSPLYKTDENDYDYMEILGSGSFGRVIRVRHKSSGINYAMKVINKTGRRSYRELRESGEEDEEHRLFRAAGNYPFICTMYHYWYNRKRSVIILELIKAGNLQEIFDERHFNARQGTRKPIPIEIAKIWIAEIILAIEHLHSRFIVFRDLKPDNILLDDEFHVKLVDFGVAIQLSAEKPNCSRKIGGSGYKAPEMFIAADDAKAKKNLGRTSSFSFFNSANNKNKRHSITTDNKQISDPDTAQNKTNGNNNNTATPNQRSSLITGKIDKIDSNLAKATLSPVSTGVAKHASVIVPGNKSNNTNINSNNNTNTNTNNEDENNPFIDPEGYSYSVDWWNIGVLIRQMLTAKHPFYRRYSLFGVDRNVRKTSFSLKPASTLDKVSNDLILQLLQREPEKRLGCRNQFTPEYHTDGTKLQPFQRGAYGAGLTTQSSLLFTN